MMRACLAFCAQASGKRRVGRTDEDVHSGEPYHQFMLASPRDQLVRDRFQQLALSLLPPGASVLDFGAGTGIDAKAYVANGHPLFVYEPSPAMSGYLALHCREEIEHKTIVSVSSSLECRVHAVTANFAVLNHIPDQAALFEQLSRVVVSGGFVLASMLNPYYLGDARYRWWRSNLLNLVRHGHYAVDSESRIHRFAPRVVAHAAKPHFQLERVLPRGIGMAGQLYLFLLLRRR